MATLGVNIDHVATLRQQRGTKYPDPVEAAFIVQNAGADQLTVHLREDRRHIQERDIKLLKEILQIPLNLEIGNTHEMIDFACFIKPFMVTLVPEKREEKTTEGGLNLEEYFDQLKESINLLQMNSIPVSLFIEPSLKDITLTKNLGAKMIELHTGKYADSEGLEAQREYEKIVAATEFALENKIQVHAGHGLNYQNAQKIAKIKGISDLNIGHSIVSYALFVGLEKAVREMKKLIS
ncbi:pyridoxine 5'-phosphate synthase [Pigmentibacter sp. JX0631]|uniref:pyridoxine 5'-phosphate synthase n=1 Tax=Pigmentibacter sp. JX0631 TaxID=2976982 RepID=UPI002469A047|nr:pyridoxine 5'-phosphate synthase [Pigmentibacter sp. JX0631]WGL59694.1 pyridoxine 5'-phosphate synthase [Pigmentibacter sp. JX0631]